MNSKIASTKIIHDTSFHQILTIIIKEINMSIKGNQRKANTKKKKIKKRKKKSRTPIAENFMGEEKCTHPFIA